MMHILGIVKNPVRLNPNEAVILKCLFFMEYTVAC